MNTIQKHIRKTSILQMILPLILIAAIVFVMSSIPFRQIFSPQQLYNVWDSESAYNNKVEYVTLHIDEMFYTGYDIMNGDEAVGSYYYCLTNDSCIFIILDSKNKSQNTIEDYDIKARLISSNQTYEKMISEFSQDLKWNESGLLKVSSDVILDETEYTPSIYGFLLAMFILSLGILVGYIAIHILYTINPATYPICTRRDIYDNKRIIKRANYELTNEEALHIGSMYLTKHFFIDLKFSKVIVIPIGRLAWAYRLGTKNIFYKSKPHYSLYFTLKNGKKIDAHDKSSEASSAIIRHLASLDYNIVCGYTEEKKQMVKSIIKEKRTSF